MKSTLTNEQLIAKAKQWVKELCESGGRKWSLRVPVDLNHDPDAIFIELCNRLEEYAQQSQPSGMRWVMVTDETMLSTGQYFVKIGPLEDKIVWGAKKIIERFMELKKEQGNIEIFYLDESSPAGSAEGIKCKCPDNIKHGQTSVMCCNHCGLPDEDFYDNRG